MANNNNGIRDYKHRIHLFGDQSIISNIFKANFWMSLIQFMKRDSGVWIRFWGGLIAFIASMFAFSIRVFLRKKQGIFSIGWILSILTGWMILLFNFTGVPWKLAPLAVFFTPIHDSFAHFTSGTENAFEPWYAIFMSETHSDGLFIFFIIYSAMAIFRLIESYRFQTGDARDIQRGVSLILDLIPHPYKNDYKESYSTIVAESVLFLIAAATASFIFQEQYLGLYLLIATICHFGLETVEFIPEPKVSSLM